MSGLWAVEHHGGERGELTTDEQIARRHRERTHTIETTLHASRLHRSQCPGRGIEGHEPVSRDAGHLEEPATGVDRGAIQRERRDGLVRTRGPCE